MHQYLLKASNNRTNNEEYDSSIWQYNIYYTNRIIMKDVIIAVKKMRENGDLLALNNVDKIAIVEVTKMSNTIDLDNKYSLAIGNTNMNTVGNLGLTSIKKY